MAKNAVTIFDGKQAVIPDYLQNTLGNEKNIVDRVSVPSLSYGGKVWTIHKDGEKTKIMKVNEEGDEVAVPLIRVVVLDYAKRRGRAYYEGAYDPDKQTAPLCWSEDGVKPHPSIAEPQHTSCEGCQWSVKGSKQTDNGRSVTACSQHRMIVVAPLAKLDMPLRMKIAITSDWDKQNEEAAKQNWFAFNNYTDAMRARNIQHTAMVVTKMKFDINVDYPKVLFGPDRYITEEEAEIVQPLIKSDEVKNLLSNTWTPAGSDGVKIAAPDDEEEAPKPKKAAPKKAAAPVEEDEEEEEVEIIPPKKAAAKAPPKKAVEIDAEEEEEAPPPKKAPPAKAPPKKAAVVEEEEEEEEAPPPPKKSAPAKAAPKKAAAPVDDEEEDEPKPKKGKGKADEGDPLGDILSDWGED